MSGGTAMASVLTKKLTDLQGQEIVVVMLDNRAFRGVLVEFDDESIVLRNVVEALPNAASGWEEPTASTGIVHKVVTWQGVFSHEDNKPEIVRLKDVIIRNQGVLRIWEWTNKNLGKPEHVEVQSGGGPMHSGEEHSGPATRVSRR